MGSVRIFGKKLLLASAVFACVSGMYSPASAGVGEDAEQALIKDGKFYANVRYRYEYVEQDGIANKAQASTVRTRFGFETGVYEGFQALAETELIGNIGGDEFNDTVNGKTTYPVVADPQNEEINQFWISWSGLPDTKVKVGRQRVNIDNQRFVGAVGWRQNEQTFDAAFVTNSSIPNLDLQYGYIDNVNRIFGDDHPLGDLDSDIHVAHAAYKFAEWLNAAAYAYLMEFELTPGLSNKTYGARASGKVPLNDITFGYLAEYAMQDDYENNPASYDEDYFHVSPSVSFGGLTLAAGLESLGGNGANAFATPLATLHAFNGWADKFLATPGGGLKDAYVKAVYKADGIHKVVDGTKFVGVYHDFESEGGGTDYGEELDLLVSRKIPYPDFVKGASVAVKYADYDADSLFTDTEKFWFVFNVNF